MLTDILSADGAGQLQAILENGLAFLLNHSLLILLGVLLLLFVSDLLMRLRRVDDPRRDFLAEFLGVRQEDVIPLAPATGLWGDFCRVEFQPNAATQFPHGAPTLQGSYLVLAGGGFTLVAVHNFESQVLYQNLEHPELRDIITGTLRATGRILPSRIPLEIEQDAIRRANLLQIILRRRFGFDGALKVCTLLRDETGRAPAREIDATSEGVICERFTFEEQPRVQRYLADVERPLEMKDASLVSDFLMSWPRRQTSRFRAGWRIALALSCAALIYLTGEMGLSAENLKALFH